MERNARLQSRDDGDMPLISVITVVLNACNTIERTIQSVIFQSYRHIEFIVIDGGSTDGTIEILKKYQPHIHHWVSEPDSGIYDAMNKGARSAGGDWIIFLGADDILVNCLEEVATYLKKDNTVYYGDVYWKGFHELYGFELSPYRILTRNICHQGIFYPRAVFEKYAFDLQYHICADHYLNIQCYCDRQFRMVRIPVMVAIYSNEGMSTGNDDVQFRRNLPDIARQRFPFWTYLLFLVRTHAIRLSASVGIKSRLKALLHIKH